MFGWEEEEGQKGGDEVEKKKQVRGLVFIYANGAAGALVTHIW